MGFRAIALRKWFLTLFVIVLTPQLCYGVSSRVEGELVTAVNNFAFKFYKKLTVENKKSFICSPYSAATALTMLLVGARSRTGTELSKTLRYRETGDSVQQIQNEYRKLLSDQHKHKKGLELHVANSLWVKKGETLLETYQKDMENNFLAKGKEINFEKSSTKNEINKWIRKATKGKIPKMLDEINPLTILMLINVVYFKGDWKHSFNKSLTRKEEFHNAFSNGSNKNKNVHMMETTGIYKHGHIESLNAEILILPYKRHQYSMLILLPDEKMGLREVEKKLTAKIYNDAVKHSHHKTIQLYFPRLNLSSTLTLNQVLKSLGAKLAFKKTAEFSESALLTENADFSGINGKNNLFVSKIIQKAVCEVNEKGSIPVSATLKTESSPRSPLEFSVDHPFLFIIRHERTGLILFMGRVFEM